MRESQIFSLEGENSLVKATRRSRRRVRRRRRCLGSRVCEAHNPFSSTTPVGGSGSSGDGTGADIYCSAPCVVRQYIGGYTAVIH